LTKEELIKKGLTLIPISEISIIQDPTVTEAADFTVEDNFTFASADGIFVQDSMAVYPAVTKKSHLDLVTKVGITNNLLSQTDLSIVPRPNQDIILGIWAASTSQNTETRNIKGQEIPFEQYLLNTCFPEDYPIQLEPMTKHKLFDILNDLAFKYPPDVVIKTLDSLKTLGFLMSTIKGYSLSLKDLYSEELDKLAEQLTGDKSKDIPFIKSKEVLSAMRKLPLADFIDSGARGSWSQATQLIFTKGYVSDVSGTIHNDIVRNSLVKGLNQREFFDACWGARKGLLDTALSTGTSGYLTRQLIYATNHIELSSDIDDCKTTEGLIIPNVDKDLANTLTWRYMITEDGTLKKITRKNVEDIIGKDIVIRSPIYCKSPKICKKCYGDLFKILHSTQIGKIATQAVGERSVQLVLQVFHTGGAALSSGKTDNFDAQEDIVSGMTMANKLFHSPHKMENTNPLQFVKLIYELFNDYKKIQTIHYEVITAAMMWRGDRPWRMYADRTENNIEWVSIMKIPGKASWLLGAAFSSLRSELLNGVVKDTSDIPNSLSNLFRI
jgi:hypothetical protein